MTWHDAPASVRRAYTREEMRSMLAELPAKRVEITRHYLYRMGVAAVEVTRPEFDIAVIGGGPAGTAAAITAARLGARVVLFEAGEFPRQKVCGEFVSAESLGVLRDLLRHTSEADNRSRKLLPSYRSNASFSGGTHDSSAQ